MCVCVCVCLICLHCRNHLTATLRRVKFISMYKCSAVNILTLPHKQKIIPVIKIKLGTVDSVADIEMSGSWVKLCSVKPSFFIFEKKTRGPLVLRTLT